MSHFTDARNAIEDAFFAFKTNHPSAFKITCIGLVCFVLGVAVAYHFR